MRWAVAGLCVAYPLWQMVRLVQQLEKETEVRAIERKERERFVPCL